ncbi:unnamed protein product [Dracunculus medinensis]|uniref:Cytochrome P450 n=1 Tax=Dracunculus medinensis TaxID=318479 RepID=A0A0N4UJI2_DRAME|nr:unnamed protein product [Dracunculus medinensis]
MFIIFIIKSSLLLFLIYIIYETYWKRRFLPPGPLPWPIAGNVPSMLFYDSLEEMFLIWKQKYGNVITVWIGPIPFIMVCEIKTMKKYFVQNAEIFSNRWRNHITDTFMNGANGIVQVDGDKWREQRRFALSVLRDYGVGRAFIEEKIQGEIDSFINFLKRKSDQDVDICQNAGVSVANIINSILFGSRFDQEDQIFHKMHAAIDRQFQLVVHPIMSLYITAPYMTKIPVINKKWKELMELRDDIWRYIYNERFDPNNKPTDFVYSYLKEMHKRKIRGDPGYFHELQLRMVVLDLLFAGMETTATTLKWGFLYVMLNLRVQDKIQEELDQFPSKITLSHKNSCPYTCATINEIQRLANILPFNLPRTVADDISIDGYFIPKNTLCIPQISVVLNDPSNFDNPKEFRPERFLCDDGKTIKKFDEFIPFSLGKRQCVGESLAKSELFLIFANILRNFNLKPSPLFPLLSTKRLIGLTVSPPKYLCKIELRNKYHHICTVNFNKSEN